MRIGIFNKTMVTTAMGLLVLVSGMVAAITPVAAQGPAFPEGAKAAVSSPADNEIAYAAKDRTIYRSDDGGQSWAEAATLPSVVTTITPANQDPSLVYIGTESGGIFRSFDEGTSWQAINDGLGMTPGAILEVSALAIDPQRDHVLVAATGYWLGTSQMHFSPLAIMASSDSGATWLQLTSLPLNGSRVTSLLPDASRPLAGSAQTQIGVTIEYDANVEALTALLADTNASSAQRVAAAQALGLVQGAAAIPVLTEALNSDDIRLAVAAAQALGAMQATQAVPALRQMLNSSNTASPSAAAEALAAIGTPEATDALFQALGNETTPSVQHAAKSAIEQPGSPAVAGLLALMANGAPTARRAAAEMLGWIADPASVDGLVTALQSEDPELRGQVAWALGEIGNSTAQQTLTTLAANDPNPDVRLQATQALAHQPEPPRMTFEPAAPETQLKGAQPVSTATIQNTGLRTPEWLSAILPALRWLILVIVLALVAFLPWYQTSRENRRQRHN